MCGIHVAYILCVEKRKFLAFKQCITKVNLTRNDEFRSRFRIWHLSCIHLKRVQTLSLIRRHRNLRLRGLYNVCTYNVSSGLCLVYANTFGFFGSKKSTRR